MDDGRDLSPEHGGVLGGQHVDRLPDWAVVDDERADFLGVVGQLGHLGGSLEGHLGPFGVLAAISVAVHHAFGAAARDPELVLAILAGLGDLRGRDLELGRGLVVLGPGHGFKLLTLVGG